MAAKKQTEIPGTERKSIPEVDTQAEVYRAAVLARVKKSKTEKQEKDKLIAVMRKHGLNVYRDDNAVPPIVVSLSSTDSVKVTVIKSEGDQEEAADDEEE